MTAVIVNGAVKALREKIAQLNNRYESAVRTANTAKMNVENAQAALNRAREVHEDNRRYVNEIVDERNDCIDALTALGRPYEEEK